MKITWLINKIQLQDDDLENTYGQTLGSGLEEEVGYGKSPEWVEVDGHIVSKGVVSLAREHGQDPRSGSVLSLPYSSRTQLTYNRYGKLYEVYLTFRLNLW